MGPMMSYRATAHRVTRRSPAALLYGRELRLPAQLGDPRAMTSTVVATGQPEQTEAIQGYSDRLHDRMAYAWAAARDASLCA